MPTGLPASVMGTTPQSSSRKIMTASSAVLAGEQVRGATVIASATLSIGLTRSDSVTRGTGSFRTSVRERDDELRSSGLAMTVGSLMGMFQRSGSSWPLRRQQEAGPGLPGSLEGARFP